MNNDWKSLGHGTLSERRARQLFFAHVFFLMCCSISFPLFELLNSAIHVDIIFVLFTLQSCVKLIYIKNETWKFLSGWRWERIVEMVFFVLVNQQTQSYLPIPCFFFRFMFLSYAFANPLCFLKWFLCFDGPYTGFIWFIHIDFFFTLFTKSVGFVSFFSPMQHSHIHTVFKHYHEQDAMIEKQNLYNVTNDWWKLVKKGGWNEKKKWVVRLLTMEKHGRSGHWVRKIPANHNTGNIEGNSVFGPSS